MTCKLLQQALEALETCDEGGYSDIDGDWVVRLKHDPKSVGEAIQAIRAELAKPNAHQARNPVDVAMLRAIRSSLACAQPNTDWTYLISAIDAISETIKDTP